MKGGLEYQQNNRFLNSLTIGDTKSTYTSLTPGLSGFTANDIDTVSLSGSKTFRVSNVSDFGGFIRTHQRAAEPRRVLRRVRHQPRWNDRGSGVWRAPRLTTTRPATRTAPSITAGPSSRPTARRIHLEGLEFLCPGQLSRGQAHLQRSVCGLSVGSTSRPRARHHDLRLGRWAASQRGLRPQGRRPAEGVRLLGPLLRPGPDEHDAFAGSLTGRTREEQVWVGNGINQWVTYRVRGGAVLDGFFAPTTKTPFTDDLQLGYSVDLGRNMSFDIDLQLPSHARHPRRLRRGPLRHDGERLDGLPGPDQRPDSLFLGSGLLRVRRESRGQLHHRHARGWGTQLSRSRVEPAQAVLGQLAGARELHLQPCDGQYQLRFERRLPG